MRLAYTSASKTPKLSPHLRALVTAIISMSLILTSVSVLAGCLQTQNVTKSVISTLQNMEKDLHGNDAAAGRNATVYSGTQWDGSKKTLDNSAKRCAGSGAALVSPCESDLVTPSAAMHFAAAVQLRTGVTVPPPSGPPRT